jgi:carbon-monoxide dehydrogenase medium subunit
LREATAHVAHPAIRNRGTIGGNLAHADPASELPACMLALDATMVIQGGDGERRVAANDFFQGIYATALAADELLTAVEIPLPAPGARHFFHEYARRSGDYAMVGLAAMAQADNGRLSQLRLGYFAVGDRPQLALAAARLIGVALTPDLVAAASAELASELDPASDQQASAAMRRHLAGLLLARCVATILDRPDLAPEQLS